MDVDRLNTGEKIAGVSAVLLFVFMFFEWFGVEISGENGSISFGSGEGGNAWQALDIIPFVLLIAIVVALVNAFLRLSDSDYEPPISMNVAVAVLGGLAALLVLYRVISPPDFGSFGGVSVEATRAFGLYLGLLASIGVAFGGYKGMQEEGTTFGDTADRLSSGGNPPPPPASGGTPPPPPPPPPSQ